MLQLRKITSSDRLTVYHHFRQIFKTINIIR